MASDLTVPLLVGGGAVALYFLLPDEKKLKRPTSPIPMPKAEGYAGYSDKELKEMEEMGCEFEWSSGTFT